ncbi:ABC transporter permease [Pantoea sp. B65]|uniref:ABC transporter permease n=1 Tax=Pantoea sp. B65 TaxID=2813359 RepID=UPI0039B49F59
MMVRQPATNTGFLLKGDISRMNTARQTHVPNGYSSDSNSKASRKVFFNRRRTGRWMLNLMAAISLLYILTPLIFVAWLSFYQQEIPSFPPEGYSFRWYAEIANNQQFMDGFILSLQVGLIATFIGLIVGVPAAMCLIRYKFIGRGLLNNLLLLPLLVPGVVLGTAFYVFQVQIEIATDGRIPVIGSMGGLIFGHVLIVIPWTVRLVATALSGFDTRIEEAAQNLGANRWVTFRRITLPAILPGIVAAGMFSFVNSFTNLEMSLFLIGPGSTTLPIATLQYLQWKLDPTIAAVSVLQILVVAVAMLVTDRYVKISRVV